MSDEQFKKDMQTLDLAADWHMTCEEKEAWARLREHLTAQPAPALPDGYALVDRAHIVGLCRILERNGDEDGVAKELRELLRAAPMQSPPAAVVPDRNAIDDAIWGVLNRHNCSDRNRLLRVELIEAVFGVIAAAQANGGD